MVLFQIYWRFYYIPYTLFALCFLSKNAFSLKLYALIGLVCVLLNFSCVSDLILISLPSLLSLKNKRNVTNQFTWINLKQWLNVETNYFSLLFSIFSMACNQICVFRSRSKMAWPHEKAYLYVRTKENSFKAFIHMCTYGQGKSYRV